MLRRVLPLLLLLGCSSAKETPHPSPSAPKPQAQPEPAPVAEDHAPNEPDPAPAEVTAADLGAAARSINSFGFELYRQVASERGNLIVSPASVAIALGMTYQGATADTAQEFARVLDVEASALEPEAWHAALGGLSASWMGSLDGGEKKPEIALANRLFGARKQDFHGAFLSRSERAYGAPMERVDFAEVEPARTHINDWVAGRTRDRIENLIPEGGLTADAKLVLVNAIYFKAAWKDPFEAHATTQAPFAVGGGPPQDVPTMRHTANLDYVKQDGVTVVTLPYAGGRFSMVLAMPESDLPALEASVSDETVRGWRSSSLAPTSVDLSMPKFRIAPATSLGLRDPLRAMGLERAFTDAAEFHGMLAPGVPFQIGEVFHKGFIEVDEAGTEAAAATAVVAKGGGMPSQPQRVAFDRPFLFFIVDQQTAATLFMGRVVDPRSSGG